MLVKPTFGRLFFSPDDGDGGGGGNPATTNTTPAPETQPQTGEKPKVEFSAEQQAVIDALIGTARKEGRTAAEQAAADAKAKADADAALAEQVKQGKFEEAETEYKRQLGELTTDRDDLAEKVAAYETLIGTQVDAAKAALPAEALTGYPEDADPLTRMTWLAERETLIKALGVKANSDGVTKLPKTPAPNGKPDGASAEQRKQWDAQFAHSF
jgi:hypothetical protein